LTRRRALELPLAAAVAPVQAASATRMRVRYRAVRRADEFMAAELLVCLRSDPELERRRLAGLACYRAAPRPNCASREGISLLANGKIPRTR
jgi:hypothetical protein